MRFGSPLNQAFLVNAVDQMAEGVVASKEDVLRDMAGSIISGEAWVRCAEQWIADRKKMVLACDDCCEPITPLLSCTHCECEPA